MWVLGSARGQPGLSSLRGSVCNYLLGKHGARPLFGLRLQPSHTPIVHLLAWVYSSVMDFSIAVHHLG